ANTFLGFRGAVGQDANDWSLDMLAVQPLERDINDWDKPVDGRWLYGLIGHWRRIQNVTLEPFYLAIDQNQTATASDRFVHSPGLRAYGIFGNSGFDFDGSLIRQFGHNGDLDVDAWAGNVEIGYRFKHAWKPRLSAFYGYASGDRDPNDGVDNRFERFYGFGRPWSANDYIVFENINTPKLRLELTPTEKLRVDLGYSWYYLASDTDRFAGNNERDKTGQSGSAIGHEFDIRARWQVRPDLETIVGYAHFTAGEFTRNTLRPDDTDFAYLEVNWRVF
ncbi:MAG: alginate export family protein, partial [Verrucomicrobia bacterium]